MIFDHIRNRICAILGGLGILVTGCTKTKYVWSTEEEYFKVPIWKEHVKKFKKIKAQPHTVKLFIGDSITEGFDLNRHLNMDSLVNMGISGDVTSGILKRLYLVEKLQPKKIFIMIGINDIRLKIPMERIQSQYAQIIQSLKLSCPDAEIYVQSVLPARGIDGTDMTNEVVAKSVRELNHFLEKQCVELNVHFLYLYPLFEEPKDFLRQEYTYDGIHLCDEGYRFWSEQILHLLTD